MPWVFSRFFSQTLGFSLVFSHLTNYFYLCVLGFKSGILRSLVVDFGRKRVKIRKLELMTKKRGSSEILADKKEFFSGKVGFFGEKLNFCLKMKENV